jgi:cytosine/creatinine deaminase
MDSDQEFMALAFEQARKSYADGGVPVGAVMVENGQVIAAGHNQRVQNGDPIAHGEMACIQQAGRRARYYDVTLFTTLSPCMMCADAIVQFGIGRVVVGENRSFSGNIDFLREHGVEVTLLDDERCRSLMDTFIAERPELWDEDIAGNG